MPGRQLGQRKSRAIRKSPAAKKAEETLNEKKSRGKKKASSGKRHRERNRKPKPRQPGAELVEKSGTGAFMGTEVAIIVSLQYRYFLFLSNFGLCGFVGSFLRSTLLGVFGVMGYLVPFLYLWGLVFIFQTEATRKP